jgi:hypothetical protein
VAVLVIFDSPARRADVEAITDSMELRDKPAKGLICHLATDTSDGVRIYDVWESEEDFQQFAQERIIPATRVYLQKRNLPSEIPLPPLTVVEAYDIVRGA